MNIDLDRKDILNLLKGIGVPPGPSKFDNLITFTGNQHNESWKWEKEQLDRMSKNELIILYQKVKKLWYDL